MSDTCDTVTMECVDCGMEKRMDSAEAILRSRAVCSFCYIQRGILDYQDWCGAMECEYDAESADEYLSVTSYGQAMPEWIQVRVKEWAAKAIDTTLRVM